MGVFVRSMALVLFVHFLYVCRDAHDRAKDEATRARKAAELEILDREHADAVVAAETVRGCHTNVFPISRMVGSLTN